MNKELLEEYAKKLSHCVHRLDEKQKEPFKDDEEYEFYLWQIERVLFKFWEDGFRKID